MKKFLSILMLACLLALGMALPAAAVGEETQLFAAFSEGGTPSHKLNLPKDMSRNIYFFTLPDGTNFERVTEGTYKITENGNAVDFDGVNRITGLEVTGEGAPVKIAKEGSVLSPVEINVVPSQFEVKVDGGEWQTSQIDLKVGYSVGVAFRLVAQNKNLNIYDDVTESVTVAPASGLSFNNGRLSATTAGDYTLNYKGYTIPVSVNASSATITKDELSHLQDSETDFVSFLRDNKGYSGTGDFTLLLPAGNIGSVECNAQLPDRATLTLKGAANGTSITDLKVTAPRIAVEDITFTGNAGISLHGVDQCEVKNCSFRGVPFHIYTDSSGSAPLLRLTDNDYYATDFANVYDNQNVLMATWRVTRNDEQEDITWYLGQYEWYKPGSQVLAFSVYLDSSVDSLIKKGWTIELRHPCAFASVYTTKDRTAHQVGDFEPNSDPKTYVMSISEEGEYAVISGSYPKLSDKNEVVLRDVDVRYLCPIAVETTFSGANVTHNGVAVPAWISNKKLYFYTTDKKPEGTYKVTATTAATTTKTPTTSRTYKYTYQDFYRVTPAGFTNAMRYVKDNLVTLNCTEAGTRSISLPVASMAAAAEKGYSVLVKAKNAELTMDAAALKSMAQQAKGSTVLLHYKSLNHKTLTTVGQASIQSHLAQFPGDNADLAFLVTATSDSETIEDLQMGTITLRIPFILLPGTEGMANTVYALQSESIAEARETTVADGHLTTKLLDLTEHMVFLTTEAAQPTEETTVPAEETTESTQETIAETTQPETVPETTQSAQAEEEGGSPILAVVLVFGAVLLLGCGALGFLILRKRLRK